MTRSILLGAVSAAALLASTAGNAAAVNSLTGGGSTLAEFDYLLEFAQFNNGRTYPSAIFNNPDAAGVTVGGVPVSPLYWESGSGAGQNSFLYNDLGCDADKVSGADGKNCDGVITETIYGASDATLSTTQIAGWANGTSYTAGPTSAPVVVQVAPQQPIAGNLIQLPSMGVGVSFPTVNSTVTSNGQVSLSDSDLCGIFSGKITDWSTLAAETQNKGKGITAGTIQVVYRADGSGTSFLLLNHLQAVCNASNTAAGVTFAPTTTFVNTFLKASPSALPIPSNFYGENGSNGIANYISGLGSSNGNPAFTGSAIAYLTPDFTTIDPNSNATLSNGSKSTLVVAGAQIGTKYITPTLANITLGLAHPKQLLTTGSFAGPSAPPTTATQAAQTNAFVPLIETVSAGYPVVGYTTFDLAQCYSNKFIAAGVEAFLALHYNNATYLMDQNNNGFVGVVKSGAANYLTAIKTYILPGKTDTGTQIGSASACAGKSGR